MIKNNLERRVPVHETLVQPVLYKNAAEYLLDYTPESQIEKNAIRIISDLQQLGYESYFVGGFVRDLIQGKTGKDIDIATSAQPQEVIAYAKSAKLGFDEANKDFGMVRVVVDSAAFEITTFRNDAQYSDSRRPDDVSFVKDLYQDAQRRDFTFNAVYFDPRERRLIDFFGGLSDLQNKVLRFVGEQEKIDTNQYAVAVERIEEDPLRIVRAIRFAARLDMELDPAAAQALRDKKALLTPSLEKKQGVSWERKGQELNSIFKHKNRAQGLEMLDEYELLPYVLPELEKLKGVDQGKKYHQEGDVFTHIKLGFEKINKVLEQGIPEISNEDQAQDDKFILQLAWSWLLHDIAKPETKNEQDGRITFYEHDSQGEAQTDKILRRYGFSLTDLVNPVKYIIGKHIQGKNLWKINKKGKLAEYFFNPNFLQLMQVLKLDCLASVPVNLGDFKKNIEKYKQFVSEGMPEKQAKKKEVVSGNDILELGFASGPAVGIVKGLLEQAFFADHFNNRTEVVSWLETNSKSLKKFLKAINFDSDFNKDTREQVIDELYKQFF